ncbi:MAG: hypothetical protein GY943_33795 [Chloroflexi bacterium]|nr:hypothetical protein [Chloroflexota bacterium]
MSQIQAILDERVRLVTAVFAASDWPDEEQKQLTHAVHPHSKRTRHHLLSQQSHTAVYTLNQALLNGVSLDHLFSAAIRCEWPEFVISEPLPQVLQIENWTNALSDFVADTNLVASFWPEHQALWDESVAELQAILQDKPLYAFLEAVTGQSLTHEISVMPTLVYPMLKPVLASTETQLLLILPPPKAVGESPPWPYREDPGWVIARVCERLLFHLLAEKLNQLDNRQKALLVRGAMTLCLEQCIDEFEALAFLVRSKKEFDLPDLPDVVDKMRAHLAQPGKQIDIISLVNTL